MAEVPSTRRPKDGFRGDYPTPDNEDSEALYRANGVEPPWLLEWDDGKPVLDADGNQVRSAPVERYASLRARGRRH